MLWKKNEAGGELRTNPADREHIAHKKQAFASTFEHDENGIK